MDDNNIDLLEPDENSLVEDFEEPQSREELLQLARSTFKESKDFADASLRQQWEKNLFLFRSKHPTGSKYHTDAYKYRSKIFRPKTRSGIRRHCAAAATAFFSTREVVRIDPENPNNPDQVVSAELLTHILKHRLDDSIPWFVTLIGAYTDAMVQGTCISKQYWDFYEDEDGRVDRPVIELKPIENILFSQAAKWNDPIGSSPYVIELMPMYVMDVRKKMEDGEWAYVENAEIANSIRQSYDSVRQAREGNRTDSKEPDADVRDHDIVWVHEYIIKMDGGDKVFYTLGTTHILTDPVPVTEVYPQGRPFVVGHIEIEPHKQYPAGEVELGEQIQIEANDVANQRLDNIKLALNKRYFARRSGNIDYKSLTRNVPGSVTLMDDINNDVRVEATPDVTSSSYAEQDRLSTDFDEITGSFSVGSIASNRKLSETVGGMNMLNQDANGLAEYQLRVFTETWVEPVMKQLVKLIQTYESDERILVIAGEGAQLKEKYGISAAMDYMLDESVTVNVSVGAGATNPQQRIESLSLAVGTLAQFVPQSIQALKAKEIVAEVMGAVGFRDGERFYDFEQMQSPQVQELMQKVQELEQIVQMKQVEHQGRVQLEQIKQQAATQRQQMKESQDAMSVQAQQYLGYMDRMIAAEDNKIKREQLQLQREEMMLNMQRAEAEMAQKDKQSMYTLLMNDRSRFTNSGK